MLTEIKLTNFKCFKEETSIPLSRFNLFTGVNGAGKSTALQALLLMRQSIEHNPYTTELILNGNSVNLGSFKDIRNNITSESEPVIFSFNMINDEYRALIFYYLKFGNNDVILDINEITINESSYKKPEDSPTWLYKLLPPTKEEFLAAIDNYWEKIHFVSADRIGPQEFYQKSNLPEFPNVGRNGEFAVSLLNMKAQELVNDDLCLGEEEVKVKTLDLFQQKLII
jgi:predicted ATPase